MSGAPDGDALPEAAYLILASRLIPDLDGGFAVSVMRRARDIAKTTGEWPLLLTVDIADPTAHDAHRAEWQRRGLLPDPGRLRNLFDDARADPSWLVAAARPVHDTADAGDGRRVILDAADDPVLDVPYGVGGALWHLTEEPVRIYADGRIVGELRGYRELYRVWVAHVAATEGACAGHPPVLVCESRQIGEVLVDDGAGRGRPELPILHTTHACHVRDPYTWDAPMDPAWERWLTVADRFEAVLWLTPTQRADVERRVGDGIRSFVVPHPAPAVRTAAEVAPGRAVMLNSLIPRKRVDHAIRAAAAAGDVRLAVFGDGAERPALEALAAEVGADVEFAGHVADPEVGWTGADVLLLTSTSEGQPLVVLEALAHGVPVVAYDMPYGPRDMLADGGGLLVRSGDVEALTAALVAVTGDRGRRAALSAEARTAAARRDVPASMRAFGAAVRAARRSPLQPRREDQGS